MVLSARGEFDVLTTPQLRHAIREALVEAPPVLVLDVTEVEFFSSAALGALVEAREATGESTELRLADATSTAPSTWSGSARCSPGIRQRRKHWPPTAPDGPDGRSGHRCPEC
ncbi:STAS domain-containing protein [Amycolatopsis sp. NPDC023774]|uniref:STAS domain-containing protein n=1 Tax=Amycolatopsis sp. NPDC023774 TaxID=3155015 RepID=UPI00340F1F58